MAIYFYFWMFLVDIFGIVSLDLFQCFDVFKYANTGPQCVHGLHQYATAQSTWMTFKICYDLLSTYGLNHTCIRCVQSAGSTPSAPACLQEHVTFYSFGFYKFYNPGPWHPSRCTHCTFTCSQHLHHNHRDKRHFDHPRSLSKRTMWLTECTLCKANGILWHQNGYARDGCCVKTPKQSMYIQVYINFVAWLAATHCMHTSRYTMCKHNYIHSGTICTTLQPLTNIDIVNGPWWTDRGWRLSPSETGGSWQCTWRNNQTSMAHCRIEKRWIRISKLHVQEEEEEE